MALALPQGHAVDESAQVVAYNEFDPYGNPVEHGSEPYGYTGEWWGSYIELLHLRARWYSPGTGTFLSVDPVESEPPYQYVRGNPVNRIDPSGLFSPQIIQNSLGNNTSIQEAFGRGELGRSGLYHLLLDAKEGSYVYPLVVDFGEPDFAHGGRGVKYPLRHPSMSASAGIKCQNDRLVFFNTSRGHNLNLQEYLNLVEDAAAAETNFARWRDNTVRLHYYGLGKYGHSYSEGFYDDFGHMTQLPDVLGKAIGLSVPIFTAGYNAGTLVDRYGNAYLVLNATSSFGLPFSLNKLEGYHGGRLPTPTNRLLITNEEILKGDILGPGVGSSGSIGTGGGSSVPLTNWGEAFGWFSRGLDVSIGTGGGWTFGPYDAKVKAWDWLDTNQNSFARWQLPKDKITDNPNQCKCE